MNVFFIFCFSLRVVLFRFLNSLFYSFTILFLKTPCHDENELRDDMTLIFMSHTHRGMILRYYSQ